ncbi:MAG TPA: hypothetical protein VK943_00260 [Arenibaculum sp.]|nr:hypothetical protein [Arenibaculum sp.]
MSDPYVSAKVREALVAAEGSRARAQRHLLAWSANDDRLLRGLAAPFLKAIVTAAVERATRDRRDTAPAGMGAGVGAGMGSGRRPRAQTALTPEALDLVLAQMGRRQDGSPDAGNTAAGRPAEEGMRGLVLGTLNTPPPTKAGTGHVQTMKALALLYKRRRGE